MIEVQSRPMYGPAGAANATQTTAMEEGFVQAQSPQSAFNSLAADGVGMSPSFYQPILSPGPVGIPGDPGFTNPWGTQGGGGGNSPLSSLLQQLVGLVDSLLGALGGGGASNPYSSGGSSGPYGVGGYPSVGPNYGNGAGQDNQHYYSNATATSQGDPHLSFSGTNGNGTQLGKTWDSMQSHPNLLMSDSFAGGYRIGSQVTPAAANGTTKNGLVTVTTDGGATTVGMDDGGNVGIFQNGQQVSITAGQTVSLGNGESVTDNSDGSLTINDTASNGGTITTTLSASDGGVNISTTANNVRLGGYIAQGAPASTIVNPQSPIMAPGNMI